MELAGDIERHLEHLCEGDVVVLDRGYPSYETLCYLEGSAADYAVRVRTQAEMRRPSAPPQKAVQPRTPSMWWIGSAMGSRA